MWCEKILEEINGSKHQKFSERHKHNTDSVNLKWNKPK